MSKKHIHGKNKPQKQQPAPKKQVQPAKKFWNNPFVLLPAILVLTFIVFLPSLSNDFIGSWDDGVYLTENNSITQLSSENLKYYFTTPKNGTYVPLPLLSFALEYSFFGLEPFPYHFNNLLLHLLCTVLVFRILILLRLPVLYAAIGALLFGIHPMRVETVAWVTERKDLLYSVFYLGAIIMYIRYVQAKNGKAKFYFFTALLFVLSLFSKIQAVALPLVLLLIDYYLERPIKFNLLLEKIPLFGLSLAFGILGLFILKQAGSFEVNEIFSLPERLLFGLYSLCAYIVKFFAPLKLSAFYPYPIKPGETFPVLYYLAPVFLLIIAALVFFTARITRAIVFGSLFFLVNVMFLLQILGAGQAFQADRFTYISYIGLFFIAGWAAERATLHTTAKFLTAGALVFFTVFFSVKTYDRCKDWKNGFVLWSDVIEKFPGKVPAAYANRGTWYRKEKNTQLALSDFNYAVSLDPKDGITRMNRGNIFFDLGQDTLAISDYYAAMSLNMDKNKEVTQLHKLYCNLGSIYGRRGVYDSALHYLTRSIALDSNFADAHLNLGLTYSAMGQWEKTIEAYQRALRLAPEETSVYSDIGVAYQNMGEFPQSIEWFGKAISMDGNNGIYYLNRSYSYNALRDFQKAREDAIKARDLGAGIPPSYAQLLRI